MQKCKDVIPCWIMPLQQLADTITPQQEMYDYIIVDEASQLGIDAMLLLLLCAFTFCFTNITNCLRPKI
jgi:hypothetical protein